MKRFLMCLFSILFILSIGRIAGAANPYVFELGDLDDLEHGHYYTFGINLAILSNETIVAATLDFKNIKNWDDQSNDLWVHLLDSAPVGKVSNTDTISGDEFLVQSNQVLLVQYHNLSSVAQNLITYNFNAGQITSLKNYYANGGNVGLGFDPDCHYYNDGIKFTVQTETSRVPEPATMVLLGLGLVGLAGLRKKCRG